MSAPIVPDFDSRALEVKENAVMKSKSPLSISPKSIKKVSSKNVSYIKRFSQWAGNDIRGLVDPKVDESLSRALVNRCSTNLLFGLWPGVTVADVGKRITHMAAPLQVSGFATGKIAKSMGGRLTPSFSKAYETPKGKYKDFYGSKGHILCKAVDKATEGVSRMGIVAFLTSAIVASYGGIQNYPARFWKNFTVGSAFTMDHFKGGGSLMNRINTKLTIDPAGNIMKAAGANNSWLGVLTAAMLGGVGFTSIQYALNNGAHSKDSWLKTTYKTFTDRLGIFSTLYKFPVVPGLGIRKRQMKLEKKINEVKDLKKTPAELRREKVKSRVENMSNILYGIAGYVGSVGAVNLINQYNKHHKG